MTQKLKDSDSSDNLTLTFVLLPPVKDILDNTNCQDPLTYPEIVEFMEKAIAEPDTLGLVHRFTDT